MGISDSKWIQAFDQTANVGSTVSELLLFTEDGAPSAGRTGPRAVNMHGVRLEFTVSTDIIPSAGVNESFGHYALIIKYRQSTGDPSITTSSLSLQDDNNIIWAVGTWVSTPQSPARILINPKTSRNIPRLAEVQLLVENSPVSDDTVRVHGVLQAFIQQL